MWVFWSVIKYKNLFESKHFIVNQGAFVTLELSIEELINFVTNGVIFKPVEKLNWLDLLNFDPMPNDFSQDDVMADLSDKENYMEKDELCTVMGQDVSKLIEADDGNCAMDSPPESDYDLYQPDSSDNYFSSEEETDFKVEEPTNSNSGSFVQIALTKMMKSQNVEATPEAGRTTRMPFELLKPCKFADCKLEQEEESFIPSHASQGKKRVKPSNGNAKSPRKRKICQVKKAKNKVKTEQTQFKNCYVKYVSSLELEGTSKNVACQSSNLNDGQRRKGTVAMSENTTKTTHNEVKTNKSAEATHPGEVLPDAMGVPEKSSMNVKVYCCMKCHKLEILHIKEICHLQLKKRRFICLSSKFYYKSGQ